MESYHFNVNPVAKPRMTQSDRWKGRPIVNRYNAYKDLLRLDANRMGLEELPDVLGSIYFHIPMPKSWSYKKKLEMNGQLHKQKPDLDNLLKGFFDGLKAKDERIALISKGLGKYWAIEGAIILTLDE